jgi:hypothetical protein
MQCQIVFVLETNTLTASSRELHQLLLELLQQWGMRFSYKLEKRKFGSPALLRNGQYATTLRAFHPNCCAIVELRHWAGEKRDWRVTIYANGKHLPCLEETHANRETVFHTLGKLIMSQ